MTTAQRIKDLRTMHHMTMQALADQCNVSRATISMWEAGKREVGRDNLQLLADIFNVSLDYLTGNSDVSMRFLSPEELQFIDTFRSMSADQKALVKTMFKIN